MSALNEKYIEVSMQYKSAVNEKYNIMDFNKHNSKISFIRSQKIMLGFLIRVIKSQEYMKLSSDLKEVEVLRKMLPYFEEMKEELGKKRKELETKMIAQKAKSKNFSFDRSRYSRPKLLPELPNVS